MMKLSPQLQLETLFLLDGRGRILSTREPGPSPGPRFSLIRSDEECAWAVHASVPEEIAQQLATLARREPPLRDLRDEPLHAQSYATLVDGRQEAGPTFLFPDRLPDVCDLVRISDVASLDRHFNGWTQDEVPGRQPMVAIVEEGQAVSVCFCARRSGIAAEAGVETGAAWRGRGLAARVTVGWAQAIRSAGFLPIYSTSWTNAASLGVARKLDLRGCAAHWSLY